MNILLLIICFNLIEISSKLILFLRNKSTNSSFIDTNKVSNKVFFFGINF